MNSDLFRTQRQVLRDVGQCIYCKTTQGSLREEHVVPYGLNGPWVLLRASCERCAKITSAFETQILQNTLLPARVALGLRTRHKSKRPNEFSAVVEKEGQYTPVDLPIADYPVLFVLPVFLLPAQLDHRNYKEGVQVHRWKATLIGQFPDEKHFRKLDAERLHTQLKVAPYAYAQLFAKIAYGMMVAKFGLENIAEAYVLPTILGKANDAGRWVGTAPDKILNPENTAHAVALEVSIENGEVVGRISLFTLFDTPEYLVVVGRVTEQLLRASGF